MSWNTIKLTGAAGLFACGLLVLSAIVYVVAPSEGPIDTVPEYLFKIIVLFAYIAIVAAVISVHAVHRGNRRYGWLGVIGAVATGVGYGVIVAVTAISLVRDVEDLQPVRIAAAGLALAGSALLGIAVLIARVMPWWCGVLLIVAFPLGDVANEVFPVAENLLLALLWGVVGFAVLSARRPAPVSVVPGRPASASRIDG
jgi:hypothetical protein